jgi:hypothetical protein
MRHGEIRAEEVNVLASSAKAGMSRLGSQTVADRLLKGRGCNLVALISAVFEAATLARETVALELTKRSAHVRLRLGGTRTTLGSLNS